MNTKQIMELDKRYVMHTYARIPLVVDRGDGDAVGHCHPKILSALKEQSQKLLHCSNLYYIEPQAKLAERLCIMR